MNLSRDIPSMKLTSGSGFPKQIIVVVVVVPVLSSPALLLLLYPSCHPRRLLPDMALNVVVVVVPEPLVRVLRFKSVPPPPSSLLRPPSSLMACGSANVGSAVGSGAASSRAWW